MSEEKKEEQKGDIPNYMKDQKSKKQERIEKAKLDIEKDRIKIGEMARFGFFSIPYPAICNDEAYTIDYEHHHQVIDQKVVTEPRGIFTKPMKKGKGIDVYFSVEKPFTDKEIEKEKEFRENEKKKLFELVDKRRKNESTGPTFRPSGPQEISGYYKKPQIPADGPIYREVNRFKHYGPDRKVLTEQRGIYVNPPKFGNCMYPTDYFSFYFTPDAVVERVKKGRDDDEKNKLEKVRLMREKKIEYKKPFLPASLKKCDNFSCNYDTYGGITDEERKKKVEEFKEYKKKGNPRFIKTMPATCATHDHPFRAARLLYSGRDGLFNDDLYKMPEIPTEPTMSLKERLELEEKNKKDPFKSCRLMKTTHFAPPISSFTTNLKKDFPTITLN